MKLQDRGNAAAVVFDDLRGGHPPGRLRKRRHGRWAVLMAVAPMLGCAINAHAADATYTGTGGSWSDALMWTPGLPSQPNDAAILAPLSGTALVTLDIDVTNLRQLDFTPVGTNFVTFLQATNNLTIDGNLFMNGLGCTYNQTEGSTLLGGTNNAGGSLFIGNNTGDSSNYNLSGGALSVGGNSVIGHSGNGVFNHINGGHAVGGDLLLGTNAGASGTYNLNGGTAIASNLYVGGSGSGAGGLGMLNVNAGTMTVPGTVKVWAGGSNAINLSGGVLSAGMLDLSGDASRFNWTAGTLNLTNSSLSVDPNGLFGSVMVMGAGQGLLVRGGEFIGFSGTGSLSQTGGFQTIGGTNGTGDFILGYNAGSSGTATLSGGTITVRGISVIGQQGSGTLNQSGGIYAVPLLDIGASNTAVGTYNLSGGALNIAGVSYLADGGTGSFVQSSGTHTTGGLVIALQNGANGIYALSGGLLSVGNSIEIGRLGIGAINQSGGTITAGGLTISSLPGSSGTYTLGIGATLLLTDKEIIGNSGAGTFTQSGGTHHIGGAFVLGSETNSSGVINLLDGQFSAAGGETIGFQGVGVFNQSGGSNAGNALDLGFADTGRGTYNLAGGTLSSPNGAYIGDGGIGTINQSGGTHIDGSVLYIAAKVGSSGNYNLSNSASLSVAGIEVVGLNGTGAFNQTGGTHAIGQDLYIGYIAGSTGAYKLDAGSLAMLGSEYVGFSGSGTLNQAGGSHTIGGTNGTGYLFVGFNAGSSGTVTLSGGVLNVSGFTFIGQQGAGTFIQTGGSHISNVDLGGAIGGTGTYTLNGGTLAVPGITYVGDDGGGVFNQNGGTHSTPILLLGNSTNSTGTYSLSGGLLTVAGDEKIGRAGAGIFTQSAGTHTIGGTLQIAVSAGSAGTFNLAGGSLSAQNVMNNGTFNQTGGQATLLAVTGTGSLIVGGGTGTALVTANSLTQSNVTVQTGGILNIGPVAGLVEPVSIGGALTITNNATVTFIPTPNASTASGVKTNFIKTLNIGSNGLIDIQNHFISVDNTATPFVKVKQYIDAAYNNNVLTGIGDYNGRGGITSTVVKNNADFMGIGYYNGALQDPANPDNIGQILGPNSNSGTGTGIPLTQILVRPTLTGDLNGDGVVNAYDVTLFNSFGLFNQPTNLGYQAGDLNGDGVVNAKDVTIFNSAGNFNSGSYLVATASARGAKAASALPPHSASPSAELNPASGILAFSYDPATGDVKVHYNGFTGFAGKPLFNASNRALSLIDIASTGGIFALDASKLAKAATDALSSPTITGNTEINLTAVNGYLPDGTDIGRILAPGLDPAQLANALTLTFNYTGSRNTSGGIAGLIVPEPATLSLIGFGGLGLMSRRRRPSTH